MDPTLKTADITDLDATRRCVEALDLGCYEVSCNRPEHTIRLNGSHSPENQYWPLANDAQAMALVKELGLEIRTFYKRPDGTVRAPDEWVVCTTKNSVRSANLNRAIVMCVATSNRAATE